MLAGNVGDVLTLDVVKQLWRAYKQRSTSAVWRRQRHVIDLDDNVLSPVYGVRFPYAPAVTAASDNAHAM